ncbi:hypothetical protein ACQPYE_11760 [Actinosynnema sp. CA-299493]
MSATGLVPGVLALPRIADPPARLTPPARALPQVVELRGLEAVQRRLAEPETGIATSGGNTGQLDESIRAPGAALGPSQGAAERLGRLVDRLPGRKRRTQSLPG